MNSVLTKILNLAIVKIVFRDNLFHIHYELLELI